MSNPTSFQLRDTISGCVGAACLVAAGAPFDIAKVRLQTVGQLYTGPLDCISKMVRVEGLTSLWKGAGPALTSAVIENSVAFTVNGFLRRAVANGDESSISVGTHVLLGAIGGIFSATAICPAEVVKCRMQLQTGTSSAGNLHKYGNVAQAMLLIARTEGVAGLFAGLGPLLLRDIPFNAIFFGGYRGYVALLQRLSGQTDRSQIDHWTAFMAGGFAGMTAWATVFPFDVVKSRMQVAEGQAASSTWRTIGDIVRAGGARSLYKGCSAAVLRGFPANSALFLGQNSADTLLRSYGM